MCLNSLYSEVTAHLEWWREFESNLFGSVADMPAVTLDASKCRLGVWLNGACQQRCGHREEFRLLKQRHDQLHAQASEIMKLHQDGEDALVIKQLSLGLRKLSAEITQILGRLSSRYCSHCEGEIRQGVC